MKTIIAGSRSFDDYEMLEKCCSDLNITTVICGEAQGADTLGKIYAENHGIPIISMPANWNVYGKSAGYRRNIEMAKIAEQVVVFWDGASKGSYHMINIAKSMNLKLKVFIF